MNTPFATGTVSERTRMQLKNSKIRDILLLPSATLSRVLNLEIHEFIRREL